LNEISIPCAPLLRLGDHKPVDTRASYLDGGREGERMGTDTSIVKENHERNPRKSSMSQGQKRRPENTNTWKGEDKEQGKKIENRKLPNQTQILKKLCFYVFTLSHKILIEFLFVTF